MKAEMPFPTTFDRQWFFIVSSALAVGFMQSMVNPNISLFGHLYMKLDAEELSTFLGLYNLTGLIFTLAIPYVADKVGDRRQVLSIVALLSAIGFSCLSFFDNINTLYVIAICLLGPYGASSSLLLSHLRAVSSDSELALQARSFFSLSWTIGPAVASFLISLYGFSALFSFSAVLALIISGFSFCLPPAATTVGKVIKGAFQKSRFILIFLGFTGLQTSNYLAAIGFPIVIVEDYKAPVWYVGVLAGIAALIEFPLFFLLPKLTKTLGENIVLILGCLSGIIYYVIVTFTSNIFILSVCQILNAVFCVCMVGIGLTWFQNAAPNNPGLMTGLFSNSVRLSAICSAPLIAIIVPISGTYKSVLYLSCAFAFCGLIALLPILRSHHQSSIVPSPTK